MQRFFWVLRCMKHELNFTLKNAEDVLYVKKLWFFTLFILVEPLKKRKIDNARESIVYEKPITFCFSLVRFHKNNLKVTGIAFFDVLCNTIIFLVLFLINVLAQENVLYSIIFALVPTIIFIIWSRYKYGYALNKIKQLLENKLSESIEKTLE